MGVNKSNLDYIKGLFQEMLKYNDSNDLSNKTLKAAFELLPVLDKNFHSGVGLVIYKLSNDEFETIKEMFSDIDPAFDFILNEYNLTDDVYRKFRDSVMLSIAQRDFINESSHMAEKTSKRVLKNLKKIKSTKTGIYSDLIAILGIFTAITFATFGATSMLSSVFSHVSSVTVPNLGFIFITAGVYLVCLYALIAVMFVGIHKIIHSEDINKENGKYNYQFSVNVTAPIVLFSLLLIIVGFIVITTNN